MMSPTADIERAAANIVQAERLRGLFRTTPMMAAPAPLELIAGKIQSVTWFCGSRMYAIAHSVPMSRNHSHARLGGGAVGSPRFADIRLLHRSPGPRLDLLPRFNRSAVAGRAGLVLCSRCDGCRRAADALHIAGVRLSLVHRAGEAASDGGVEFCDL